MKCDVCGIGKLEKKLIRYSLQVGKKLVVIEHVPALVCGNCGETTFSPDTVEKLQKTIWKSHKPMKVLETPVYEFA